MKHMLRAATFALSAMAILAIGAASAQASPDVVVGDILKFTDGPGIGGGGEFGVQVNAGPVDQFRTFCVQVNENLNANGTTQYQVADISTFSVVNGASALQQQTAYLYTMFRAGTLIGYDYSLPGRVLSATLLQGAIWHFEENVLDPTNPFVVLANAAVSGGSWSGIGNVRIANMVLASDTKIHTQDVLVLVPEPASILAWSLIGGCFLVGHRIRRNRLTA